KPTLAEFLQDFLLAVPEKIRGYYRYGVKYLLAAGLGNLKLAEVTSQHASLFEARNAKRSPSTINCALRTLRRALRLAEQWNMLDRAPKIILAKGERQRDRVLTDDEARRYLMACAEPWRDVATIMFCLRMRPGEIYALRWEHVRLTEQGFIQIT